MSKSRLPRDVKLRLLMMLALGGAVGAVAALVSNKREQLALVGIAICFGVYAGFIIYAARNPRQDSEL